MSHLPFTLSAYFFNAMSLLTNKVLLKKTIESPLTYVFYISLLSLLALFALPFTHRPDFSTFILGTLATILWTTGAYFMLKALKIGLVSRVIPTIGSLTAVILLILASYNNALTYSQVWAVVILLSGMGFLTFFDLKGAFNKSELLFEIISADCFAFSYLVLREAYFHLDFISVLSWSRLILLPAILLVLLYPPLRKQVLHEKGIKINLLSHTSLLFVGGQLSGTVSELLLLFSISLANPALVNSLAGTQYVFLFIFTLILSKKYPEIFHEKYTVASLLSKFLGIGLIFLGLYILVL